MSHLLINTLIAFFTWSEMPIFSLNGKL